MENTGTFTILSATDAKAIASKKVLKLEELARQIDSEIRNKAERGLSHCNLMVRPYMLDQVRLMLVSRGYTFDYENHTYKTYDGEWIKCTVQWVYSMRIMTKDRRRAKTLKFWFDGKGKLVYRYHYFYSYYHVKDLQGYLGQIDVGDVIIINYQNGKTRDRILKILSDYDVEIGFKTKVKLLIVSLKNDNVALEALRKIYKEELWRKCL